MADSPQGGIAALGKDLYEIHEAARDIEKQVRAAAAAILGPMSDAQPESQLTLPQAQESPLRAAGEIKPVLARAQAWMQRLHQPA